MPLEKDRMGWKRSRGPIFYGNVPTFRAEEGRRGEKSFHARQRWDDEMDTAAMERRIAPRFGMDYIAELASGIAVVRVQIRDVSMMGCGLRIIDRQVELPDRVPAKGLLIFRPAGRKAQQHAAHRAEQPQERG